MGPMDSNQISNPTLVTDCNYPTYEDMIAGSLSQIHQSCDFNQNPIEMMRDDCNDEEKNSQSELEYS